MGFLEELHVISRRLGILTFEVSILTELILPFQALRMKEYRWIQMESKVWKVHVQNFMDHLKIAAAF